MKTVLVTGASHGIGMEIARLFGKNGYSVAINYNKSFDNAKALESELMSLGVLAKSYCADVSDQSAVKKMFEDIKGDFGGVDVLINNAGVSMEKMLCDTSSEDFDYLMGVNLKGVFLCCKEAVDFMVHQKCGAIVNISSMWGEVGASCESVYSASKAGVIGFTKALAKELAPSGITVNAVTPGAVDTKMNACYSPDEKKSLCEEIPLGRFATPAEIASAVYFIANHSYITGQILGVNGGMII